MAPRASSAALEPEAPQHAGPTVRRLGMLLGSAIVCLSLGDALDLYRAIGLVPMTEQLLALALGLALATIFVTWPFRRGASRPTLPWYDALLALISFLACVYVSLNYLDLLALQFEKPLASLIATAIILASVAECLRRTAGAMLFLFVVAFLGFGLLGHFVPGDFQGRHVAVDRLILYLGIDSGGVLGQPVAVVVSIVVPFIFFGNLLNASGGANFFTEIATALTGRYRGGSAKVAIVASSLFGSISGSAVANVVSTGVITIPMMRKGGYPPEKAAAIEAVASTGGQIMPPMMGAAAFLMAEFLQVPFTEIILASLIPAFLYYIALFVQADLYAARENIRPVDNIGLHALEVLMRGWLYLSPFVVILAGLFSYNLQPQVAAIYAIGVVVTIGLFFGYRSVRMPWRQVLVALGETGIAVTQLLMVSAMAGIVIGVLNITGLGFALTQAVIHLSGGNLAAILLLAGAISIVLGMGMPTVGVYLLLATLVVPSMVEAGIEPLAAHMFAFYFGVLSMITPPVAAATFAAATIAKTNFVRTGFEAVRFGWPAYLVPLIFAVTPAMLWQGSGIEIGRIAFLSLAGVFLISAGWIGYLAGALTIGPRGLLVLAGVACVVPANLVPYGAYVDAAGLLTGAAVIVHRFMAARGASSHV